MHPGCLLHRICIRMGKIHCIIVKIQTFRIFENSGSSFASRSGRTHFRAMHKTHKINLSIVISLNFNKCHTRTKFNMWMQHKHTCWTEWTKGSRQLNKWISQILCVPRMGQYSNTYPQAIQRIRDLFKVASSNQWLSRKLIVQSALETVLSTLP